MQQPEEDFRIDLWATSSGRRAHYYAGLTISSPAVDKTITGTRCTDPR